MQQQIHPGQGVPHPEPTSHDLRDPRQSPALVAPAGSGRAGIQHRFQHMQLIRLELAAGTAGPLGDQSLPTTRSQRTPPAIRRHPSHPEPPGHLPVTGPGLEQIRGRQPDPLTPNPLLSGQPSAIGYLIPPA